MNKVLRYILGVFAVLSFASCEGTVDPEQNGGGTPGIDEVPEGVLRIFADKTVIPADGNEEVTFTVMFGSEDVSNAKTVQLIRTYDGEEKYMTYGANRFKTTTSGTYKFKARYYYAGNHLSDNEIEIVAEPFFTGEEKNYRRRFFGTLFTSTGCTYCPLSAQGLKELQAEFPGEISAVAFHSDFNGRKDPMTIPETESFKAALGGFTGLPFFFWNMRKESELGGSANKSAYMTSFDDEKKLHNPYCGVAINSSYDKATGKLEVEAGITSNSPATFRCHLILVEDNIPAVGDYEQEGSGEMMNNYMHQNVARTVLTGANGDKINDNLPMTVGVEAKLRKSATLSPDWNAGNMRIVAVALTSEDGGYTWTANNVNECKVGESAPYLYEE